MCSSGYFLNDNKMKRFADSPFFQKFRKERRHETTTTTSTTEYNKFSSSSHREEYSTISSSEQQQQQLEEHIYGGNGNAKSLHFTQSLQDAFHPNKLDEDRSRLSKEFPPLQSEPRHYRPRNIREEQKEISEQFDDNKSVRSQRQKVFEFREYSNNGNTKQSQPQQQHGQAVPEEQPTEEAAAEERHFRTMAMKRMTERQQQFVEHRWQHASLPPLERHRPPQAQPQTPHELVLDRFPPQLVQSIHQLTDAAERRHERCPSSSRGFSPFPVFGPFVANGNAGAEQSSMRAQQPPPRQHSVPPQPTYACEKYASVPPPPSEEMSMSMTTSQYKIYYDHPQYPPTAIPTMASSSGDEWQSAYEFMPQSTTHLSMTPPKTKAKPQHLANTKEPSANNASFLPSSVAAHLDENAVNCVFNLCKFNAFSRQLATKCVWPMRGNGGEWHSKMFQSVGSIGGPQKVQNNALNESTTFSERQANEEVRKLTDAVATDTFSPPATKMRTSPQTLSRQSVKVEFSGPVNFLQATNLNVTNNRDNYYNQRTAAGSSEKQNGQIGDDRSDQRDKMTVSPPLERYIDSVCDLGPIFAEIGQTLRAQNLNSVPTSTENTQKVEQTMRSSEHKIGYPEKGTAFSYRIATIERQLTPRGKPSIELEQPAQRDKVPYLVQSTSQCHFARVSAICQEWRLERVPEDCADCAALVTVWRQACCCTVEGTFACTTVAILKKTADHRNSLRRLLSVDRLPTAAERDQHFAALCSTSFQAQSHQNATTDHATVYQSSKCHPKYSTMPPPYMSMHRTQSADRAAMEPALWWRRRNDEVENALNDVQREQAAARAYSKQCQCAEAERIERAILVISDGLRRPLVEPVSKAQAEAKEELLRVRLAELILNLDPDSNEEARSSTADFALPSANYKRLPSSGIVSQDYKEALREPIALLREKLRLLEHRLVHEDAQCVGTELRRISATPPPLRSEEQRRRHEALSVRSGEIARMTPIIGILRHKLYTLDSMCTRREHVEQNQHQQQLNHQNVGTKESRSTFYAEQKTIHELLNRISDEIEIIHELCRRDEVRDRLDAVLGVLKRVAASVDQISLTLDGTMGTDQQRRTAKEAQLQKAPDEWTQMQPELLAGQLSFTAENEGSKRSSPSKLGHAIKQQQEAQNASRTEHKQRAEQLMKELMATFKQQHSQSAAPRNDKQHPLLLLSTNQQWVHAVELSAHFKRHPTAVAQNAQAVVMLAPDAVPVYAGPAHPARFQQCAIDIQTMTTHLTANELEDASDNLIGIEKGTGGKDRAYDRMKKRRFDQTPRILCQPNMPNILQYEEEPAHVPPAFKLGACPPSYLPRDEMPRRQTQPFQYQLGVPTRTKEQKFWQLNQRHYYLCSQGEEEEEEEDIVDDDQMTASSASAVDSLSLNVPILFRKRLSLSAEPARETAILTDEKEKREENVTEIFFLRRRRKHAMLNAIIYPETKILMRASLRHGNNFEIVVERVSDCGRDSVVMVSEEFYDKRVLIRSGSPVRHSTVMEEMESSDEGQPTRSPGVIVDAHTKMAVSISARSDRDSVHAFLEEIPCGQIGLQVQAAPSSLSNTMAAIRSGAKHGGTELDGAQSAGGAGMANSLEGSSSRGDGGGSNVFRDVKVSEGFAGGDFESSSRSLRSSRRSSQKSLLMLNEGLEEVEEIPAYVIKLGSTASITCELNSDCVEVDSQIEWFRGQNEQIVPIGDKFERIREDWVELLVISDVQPEDGQLYSVKINGEFYPVAYLIVEDQLGHDNDEMDGSTPSGQTVVGLGPEPQFLTAPQTQFVLQGETAILSVQMNRANLNTIWHKDGQILDANSGGKCADGRPRIWLEGTTSGWYRIIVNDVQFSDQGYYYAQFGEQQTNVQLIVEERIDEREVQVSSAETDDEELGDYLVPFGSTATIACELENGCFGYKLHWQRNHKDLDQQISSGDGKFEHVVNRTKHYLIIHNAQPNDSGVYSVRIGDAMFKVAQITISAELGQQQNLSGSRPRRISSQSLNQLAEKGTSKANANRQKSESPKSIEH